MTETSIRERIWRLRNEARVRGYRPEEMRLIMGGHVEADLLTEVTSELRIYPTDDYRTAHGATVFGIPCEVDRTIEPTRLKLVFEMEG